LLIDHYRGREKVDRLLSLGSLSYLQPALDPDPDKPHQFEPEKQKNGDYVFHRQEGVCMFYGRDRGEKDTQAFPVELDKVGQNDWIEYCYVFTRDGTWKYFRPEYEPPKDYTVKLRDVAADLDAEFSGYGVERPPNDYGSFSNKDIANLKKAALQKRLSGAGAEM